MKEIIEKLKKEFGDYIIKIDEIPEKEPVFEDFQFKNKIINDYLNNINLKLYKHQKDALELLYNKKNVIVTTSTASGKSLIFRLYIIDNILSNPTKTFLLIYPLRALLYDQEEKFRELIEDFQKFYGKKLNINMKILLGDLKYSEKEKIIKEKPNVILTTVDNLHLYLLKNHDKLFYFFKNLDLISIDELHTYKGVFGTNSAYVFRRLTRLLKYFYKNSNFKILTLSATLKNPKEFAEKLIGEEFCSIENDYSRRYKRYLVAIDPKGSNSRIILKRIIRFLLENNIKSLIFLESRKGIEISKLAINDIDPYNRVYTYKATYLRTLRKEIERKFKNNEYLILLSTSALELGIDIGDIKCVVNYGIPFDGLFSLIQRFGRAGRSSEGLNIIIFKKDSLDFYYSTNIDKFFDMIKNNKIENIPINLYNDKVALRHLYYLINEFGRLDINILSDYEKNLIKNSKDIKLIKDPLFGKEFLQLNAKPIYTGLRNISEDTYYLTLLDNEEEETIKRIKRYDTAFKVLNMLKSKGKIIEEMDNSGFFEYLLPGMIYYSSGKIYRIKEYYKVSNIGFVFSRLEQYYSETYPLYLEDVQIIDIYQNKKYNDWDIYLGKIKVKKEYYGYIERYKIENDYIQNIEYYDNPIKQEFFTKAIWIIVPEDYKDFVDKNYWNIFSERLKQYINKKKYNISIDEIYNFVSTINKDYFYEKYRGLTTKRIKEIINEFLKKNYNLEDKKLEFLIKKLIDYESSFRSGLHAIEHNIIKISPTVTNIDSRELGGYSYPIHPQTKKPTIFIYEGYEDGVGLSQILFENIEKLIKRSIKSIYSCKCLDGCPKCILSPRCGNYNEYLDKYSARLIYKNFLIKKYNKL